MGPAPAHHRGHGKHVNWNGRIVRIEWFVLTILLVGILLTTIVWSALSSSNLVKSSEFAKVKANEYQAVFLNGGATSGSVAYTTYFGHISKLNSQYVVLKDVYYLTTSGTTDQNATPQLTKLGCQQLHSPEDMMVINRNQVAFWENLKDSGKVVTAIKQFVQQNPNGPNCNATTNSSSSNTSTGTSGTTPQNSKPTTKQ